MLAVQEYKKKLCYLFLFQSLLNILWRFCLLFRSLLLTIADLVEKFIWSNLDKICIKRFCNVVIEYTCKNVQAKIPVRRCSVAGVLWVFAVLLIIEIHEIHMVNAEIHEIQHKYKIHKNCKSHKFSQFPYPLFTLGLIVAIHEIRTTKYRNPWNPPKSKSTNTKFTPYTRLA